MSSDISTVTAITIFLFRRPDRDSDFARPNAAGNRHAARRDPHHSDFTDPKGPLLAPDSHIPQGYQGEDLHS